nr:rhodanese-like domain-containing protein [Bacteroidota bacterium]
MSDLFKDKGIKSGRMLSFSAKETVELCNLGAILVDVREEYLNSYKMFGVEKVIYLPKSKLETEYELLTKDKYLIVADSAGLRSRETVLFLLEKGFDKVANLAGGLVEWERDNMPITVDIHERLTGSCMCQLRPRTRKKKS